MAMPVQRPHVGIDVGKFRLDIATDGGGHQSIENTPKAIGEWLDSLGESVRIALEATSHYHLELALEAHRRGHEIFLINGYRLNRYRDSIGTRAKTDAGDARLLLRYLSRELDELRPWSPPGKAYQQLQTLFRRRGPRWFRCASPSSRASRAFQPSKRASSGSSPSSSKPIS
jgi:transposase